MDGGKCLFVCLDEGLKVGWTSPSQGLSFREELGFPGEEGEPIGEGCVVADGGAVVHICSNVVGHNADGGKLD